jgi:hypothetical protein
MPDQPDPPRKFYNLKPKEVIERVNDAPAENAPAINPPTGNASPEPIAPASPANSGLVDWNNKPIDVRELARQAALRGPVLDGTNAPANRENEVHGVLRDNLERANAAGLNEVELPPPRRSRRTRDYWILFIPVNGFFAFWAFGPYANPMTLAFGVGGMILFSIALTWVMFFIMDDY